mmetsp:Transcript_49978/g.98737  ORF Transcript_49978/g.98737 Transcript_49978/m.98737 type:complete len:218 (+) Transcript_49978:147-800(+)
MSTRKSLKEPSRRESKKHRKMETEAGNATASISSEDTLTVEGYLTGRCDALSRDIQAHADHLIANLQEEYERQAIKLRSATAAISEGVAATRVEVNIVARTPAETEDGESAYAGSEWTFELSAENPNIPIGRSKGKKFLTGGISLPKDGGVSTSHAKIELREGRLLYTDLGSSNGTWLNGSEVKEHSAMELSCGDILLVGNTELNMNFTIHGPSKPV